jgi:hypothetical protein
VGDGEVVLILFRVDLAPENVLQFGESLTCHCRDEHGGKVVGECLGNLLAQFVVEHVGLGYGEHAALV